jgi:quaternary ammonium compound-resistance protein SugE
VAGAVRRAPFETIWTVGLEYADGFRDLRATAVVTVAVAAGVLLPVRAVEVGTLPVGTAYAVTGVGAVATAPLGIYPFDEPVTAIRPGCICLVVAGIVGLRGTSGG